MHLDCDIFGGAGGEKRGGGGWTEPLVNIPCVGGKDKA